MTHHEARIGGLRFIADERALSDATPYSLDSDALSGWFASPDMRREVTDRPNAHGQFPAPGYLSGRIIPLSGMIQTSSLVSYEKAISALMGVLAGGGMGRLSVELESGVTWADVSRHGQPDIRHEVYGSLARYQVFFWAPDPRRFGAVQTFTGASVEAFHYGNFDATPKVTVTGVGPYTITSGGKQFVVSSALAGGQTDVIDFASGWVRRNGVLLMGGVSRAETWPVKPGLPKTPMSITAGFTMSVPVTDTWV